MNGSKYVSGLSKEFKWVVSIVAIVSIAAFTIAALNADMGAVGIGVFGLICLICVLIFFTRVKLTIGADSVLVSTLLVFRKKFRLCDIDQIRIGPYTGLAEGAGFRLLGKDRVGYLTGGDCIEIVANNKATLVSVPSGEEASEIANWFSARVT